MLLFLLLLLFLEKKSLTSEKNQRRFFLCNFLFFKLLLTNSFSVFIVKAGKIDRLLLFVICLLGTFCTWMYIARQPSGPWTGTRTGSSPRGSSSSLRRSSPWRKWIRSVAFSFCLKHLDKYLDLKISHYEQSMLFLDSLLRENWRWWHQVIEIYFL